MAAKILVQLKRHDQIDDIIPYVEKVARPGMKVIFLIRYPIEPWLWVRDHWVTMESPREAMMAGRKIMERYSWETQKGLAEKKVFPAREALRKRGVEVVVDVYTGRLTEVVRSYTLNGDVHLIMIPTRSGHLTMRLLQGTTRLFGMPERPSVSPVLLLHPDQEVCGSHA
jgi:hypothetical protein